LEDLTMQSLLSVHLAVTGMNDKIKARI